MSMKKIDLEFFEIATQKVVEFSLDIEIEDMRKHHIVIKDNIVIGTLDLIRPIFKINITNAAYSYRLGGR